MMARPVEAAAASQHAQDVVGLGQRLLVAGGFGKLERPACPRQRQIVPSLALRDEAEVGVEPGADAGRLGLSLRQRRLEMALGEIPLPEPLVDAAKLALDPCEAAPVTQRGRRLVARERLRVFAEQGVEVPDSLVEHGGFRVSQRGPL
jgi:hypothetical protein